VGEYDAKKLRELTREEIEIRLRDMEEEYQNLRLRSALKQDTNLIRVRHLRRAVARARTLLHEDSLGIHSLAKQAGPKK
jgi:large subunit ribosomal protein L29